MANRDNHYEAAFEGYLRARTIPYVAVDERKRALLNEGSLKSLDFIVSPDGLEHEPSSPAVGPVNQPPPRPASWLVDVKGRRFPSGTQKQYWKNWSTQDDLWSLAQWERLFGQSFKSLFVFAYIVVGERSPLPEEQLYAHRGARYGFLGVELAQYARWARPISPAWDTVAVPTPRFRELAVPVDCFF